MRGHSSLLHRPLANTTGPRARSHLPHWASGYRKAQSLTSVQCVPQTPGQCEKAETQATEGQALHLWRPLRPLLRMVCCRRLSGATYWAQASYQAIRPCRISQSLCQKSPRQMDSGRVPRKRGRKAQPTGGQKTCTAMAAPHEQGS